MDSPRSGDELRKKNHRKILIFSIEIDIFQKCRFQLKKSKILTKIFRKSESFSKIFLNFFGKYFFDMKKSIFFDDFFFLSSSPDRGDSV